MKITFFPTLTLLLIIVRILKIIIRNSACVQHHTNILPETNTGQESTTLLQDLCSSCCNQHPSYGCSFVSSASAYSISVTDLPVPRSIKKLMHRDVRFIIHHHGKAHKQEARQRLGDCWGSFVGEGNGPQKSGFFINVNDSTVLLLVFYKFQVDEKESETEDLRGATTQEVEHLWMRDSKINLN